MPDGTGGERRGRAADLAGHEIQRRRGRPLAGTEAPAWMAQQAELHGEAEAVHTTALGPEQCRVFGAEHVVSGHLGRRGRDVEQTGTLLAG